MDCPGRLRRSRTARGSLPHLRRARRGHHRRVVVGARELPRPVPWAPSPQNLPSAPTKRGRFRPTPMSWPLDAVHALLGGTQLHADATAARDTLGRQYAALFPALSDHMSEVFPRELYTPENFRAATEAWNSYGMTVQAERRGGEVPAPATCLPPVALLCNHSAWPHAVRGTADCEATRCTFPSRAPCERARRCSCPTAPSPTPSCCSSTASPSTVTRATTCRCRSNSRAGRWRR